MIKRIAIAVAILVCLLAAWIYAEKRSARSIRPTARETNLVTFLEERTEVTRLRKFTHNGKPYVEVIGKPQVSLLSLPSGSPAYIFDETGTLVDWCSDLGDNQSFARKWGGFSNGTSISSDEAKQLVKPPR
jgi:hypothetical protein